MLSVALVIKALAAGMLVAELLIGALVVEALSSFARDSYCTSLIKQDEFCLFTDAVDRHWLGVLFFSPRFWSNCKADDITVLIASKCKFCCCCVL